VHQPISAHQNERGVGTIALLSTRLSHEIHCWFSFLDDVVGETLLARYGELLTEKERRQQSRFHFERDRLRYLITRALVRTCLSYYAPIAPADWIFAKTAYGRPVIRNRDAIAQSLSFNVSHADGLIALAIARDIPVGIDVEKILVSRACADIALTVLASQEAASLRELSPAERPLRFLEYWTLKESYIKARGLGLSIPLSEFAFRLSGDHEIELRVEPTLKDVASRWHFKQLTVSDEYMFAICAGEPRTIITRRIVPLVGHQPFELKFLRSTAFSGPRHPDHKSKSD
jgi:4'-phosphopantetheinyl transferase